MKAHTAIKTALSDAKISQKELADRLGVSPEYISQLCSGSRGATEKMLEQIASALNCRLEIVVSFISEPGL